MTGTPEARPGGEVVVYEAPDGEVALNVRLEQETVWLTMRQMADLFERDRSVVNRHVLNVFQEGRIGTRSNLCRFCTGSTGRWA